MIYNICKTDLPHRKISKIVELFANEHPECNIPINIVNGYGRYAAYGYFTPRHEELGLNLSEIFYNKSVKFPSELKVPLSLSTILIHELYHYKQYCDGDLHYNDKGAFYNGEALRDEILIADYWKLPWEANANENMANFYHKHKLELKKINKLSNCSHLAHKQNIFSNMVYNYIRHNTIPNTYSFTASNLSQVKSND